MGREKDGAADGNLRGGSFPFRLASQATVASPREVPFHFPKALFVEIAALGACGGSASLQ